MFWSMEWFVIIIKKKKHFPIFKIIVLVSSRNNEKNRNKSGMYGLPFNKVGQCLSRGNIRIIVVANRSH